MLFSANPLFTKTPLFKSKPLFDNPLFTQNTPTLVPTYTANFMTGTMPTGWVTTRASAANRYNAAGALEAIAVNMPRLDYNPQTLAPRGLRVDGVRTNYLLNSTAPVTQTVTLATGTYTVWMVGTGNLAVAAGTAVGTGFGTASNLVGASSYGTTVTIVITTAGTVTFTVNGSVLRFQCENGAFPTSFITTAGAATQRASEFNVLDNIATNIGYVPLTGGTLVVTWLADATGIAGVAGRLDLNDTTAHTIFQQVASTFQNRLAGSSNAQASLGGMAVVPGTVYKTAYAFAPANHRGSLLGGAVVQVTSGGVMTTAMTKLRAGSRDSDQHLYGWVQKIEYYNTPLTDAQLMMASTL